MNLFQSPETRMIEVPVTVNDGEPHVGQAYTETLINRPNLSQILEFVPNTWESHKLDYTISEPDNTGAWVSAIQKRNVPQGCNFIIVNPSAKGSPIHVALDGEIRWTFISNQAYPMGDLVHDGIGGSRMFYLPPTQNRRIAAVVNPTVFATGYQDSSVIVFGYISDKSVIKEFCK